MKVFVFGQIQDIQDTEYVKELLTTLIESDIQFHLFDPLYRKIRSPLSEEIRQMGEKCSEYKELKNLKPDFVITLGGDGTILKAVTLIRQLEIPILGINLGRLGFLASTEKSEIKEAIQFLKTKHYAIEERTMLCVESNYPVFGETTFGLNDFTLHKRDTSSMITIHTYINREFLNSYWADGVIVSTPTGSTGYSLSCGGPIVFPNSGNFVITPVAPHNMTVRPVVISDNSQISFKIEGRTKKFLCTLDSRFETISSNHEIVIKKCDFTTKMVQLENKTFSKTIHEKLNWGKDSRN